MYKTLKKKLKMFRENNMTNPKSSVENKVMTHKSSRENKVKASESFKPQKVSGTRKYQSILGMLAKQFIKLKNIIMEPIHIFYKELAVDENIILLQI